jgi:hypothetical protein
LGIISKHGVLGGPFRETGGGRLVETIEKGDGMIHHEGERELAKAISKSLQLNKDNSKHFHFHSHSHEAIYVIMAVGIFWSLATRPPCVL